MNDDAVGRRRTWIIATRNSHKVGEMRAILGQNFEYLTLQDFPEAPPVVEDAPDFAGNATKKAVQLSHWIGEQRISASVRDRQLWVLADDSGLEVNALKGAPGIHSARFAALDSGHASGNSKD